MITVISEPYSVPITTTTGADKMPPVPVSDCLRWCLQLADADGVTTAGTFATVAVTIPLTCTIPANGTVLTIWGKNFTVQSGNDFTSTSFKVVTSGLQTAQNFIQMLNGNLFFSRAVTYALTVPGSLLVTITWNECREQSNFGAPGMIFTAITALGGSAVATNGVSPVYVDGLKIVTRVGIIPDASITLSDFKPISVFEGMEPDKLCDSVGDVCVDYIDDVSTQLHTILPALTSTSFSTSDQNGETMCQPIQLEYGWTYRADCVSQSGTFMRSDVVLAINAAFDSKDPNGMRKYWYDHPDGFPVGQTYQKYLTTQPFGIRICTISYAWLWMTNNFQSTFGGTYRLRATFTGYKNAVGVGTFTKTIHDSSIDSNKWFQPVNFNISPVMVLDGLHLTASQVDYFEVQVSVTNMSNGVLQVATEKLRYVINSCGCDTTDVYFLTPAGGYSTMIVDVVSRDIVQEGSEVNLFIPCEWSFEEKNAKGGRTLVNLRQYEKIEIVANALNNNDADRTWFEHFRISPVKFIKETVDGVDVKRKLIVDTGSIKIYESGDSLTLSASCYLQDIPLQNPSNR